MRTILPLIALMLTADAAAQQANPSPVPDARDPLLPSARMPVLPPDGEKACTDRIHEVRGERGLPRLDRGTAASDEPLMIAAVDQRIDGCSVMVMRYDTRDVRPVPIVERPGRLERIPGQ